MPCKLEVIVEFWLLSLKSRLLWTLSIFATSSLRRFCSSKVFCWISLSVYSLMWICASKLWFYCLKLSRSRSMLIIFWLALSTPYCRSVLFSIIPCFISAISFSISTKICGFWLHRPILYSIFVSLSAILSYLNTISTIFFRSASLSFIRGLMSSLIVFLALVSSAKISNSCGGIRVLS